LSERRSCEFLLVRYVPDAVRNEFVNIGVMLREAGRPERTEVRFTRDWKRVRCLDPDADITMLEALESEFRKRLAESESNAQLMKTLEEKFSNTLQVTDARGCLAESLAAEL
jgi:hypothetical protein